MSGSAVAEVEADAADASVTAAIMSKGTNGASKRFIESPDEERVAAR